MHFSWNCEWAVASFPDSTPQLFIAIKSWGVFFVFFCSYKKLGSGVWEQAKVECLSLLAFRELRLWSAIPREISLEGY